MILESGAVVGVSEPALFSLKREPEEIALSIVAEIVQLRRATDRFDWPVGAPVTAPGETGEEASASATDPVCGMAVRVDGAAHTHEHEGASYYFCCAACLTSFAAEPDSFIGKDPSPGEPIG